MASVTFKAKRGQTLISDGVGSYAKNETDIEMYLRINRSLSKWLVGFGYTNGYLLTAPIIERIDYLSKPDEKNGMDELSMIVFYDSQDLVNEIIGMCPVEPEEIANPDDFDEDDGPDMI